MNEIKQLRIQLEKKNVSFLFGNGINRFNDPGSRSWERLLLDIHNKYSTKALRKIPSSGINFTEFYDLLLLSNKHKITKEKLQSEFVNAVINWPCSEHHTMIMEKIINYKCSVLTTNFDDLLPRSVNASKYFTVESRQKGFTDYYPWQCYYANNPLNKQLSGFSIWFLHGMWNYKRSIKLGLNDYIGNSLKAKELLPIQKAEQLFFKGEVTWLKPFFTKPLCIIGLGLDEQETFLRWMLLQRAFFMKRGLFPESKSWYLTGDKLSEGKILFLRKVGIEPIVCRDYKYLYDDLWKKL